MGKCESMKKVFLLFLLILTFCLCGCAKVVSTETKEVEVVIVDEYHRGMYMTPIRTGKVTTMITHPAVYRITVEYNGVEYDISGRDTYDKYKDMVGQNTIAVLEIRTYDNGEIKEKIIELK